MNLTVEHFKRCCSGVLFSTANFMFTHVLEIPTKLDILHFTVTCDLSVL